MFSIDQYPLPYPADGLAPYMSEQTVNFHHGKHVATYISNLNALIKGTPYEELSLAEIVQKSVADPDGKKIFNNAAQVWNHDIFFVQMAKDNGSKIPQKIADAFGGADKFSEQFKTAALGVFGSGWVWLVDDNGEYKIESTANADNPFAHGKTVLLALDVWEHAYYLDYQNRRGDFVDAFLDHLVNWDYVEKQL